MASSASATAIFTWATSRSSTARATLFDCIEFNPSMRWIDVMSDVGFLVMDLRDHGRPGYAARLLGAYLESTGDYAGLAVLRFYVVYRALVRAKIACLRIAQTTDAGERARLVEEYRTYLALADRRNEPASSGGGDYARRDGIGQDHARPGDRRVCGRHPHPVGRRTQTADGTRPRRADRIGGWRRAPTRTTRAVGPTAAGRPGRRIVAAGYPVVVDAAFLERWQRDLLRGTAAGLHVPFAILDCPAPEPVLRARVSTAARRRSRRVRSDARRPRAPAGDGRTVSG